MRSVLLAGRNADQDASDVHVSLGRIRRGRVWKTGRLTSLKSELAPELAYGRHRGPIRRQTRRAAVAVCLYRDRVDGWTIPLTRRPMTLRHHGGQICFPGGRIERGESAVQAALREYEEELGVPADVLGEAGCLPRHYVYASDNLIDPVLFLIAAPATPWRPDPVEVQRVIPVSLDVICRHGPPRRVLRRRSIRSPGPDSRVVSKLEFMTPAYDVGGHRIWGATAMILSHLAQRLLSLGPRFAQ